MTRMADTHPHTTKQTHTSKHTHPNTHTHSHPHTSHTHAQTAPFCSNPNCSSTKNTCLDDWSGQVGEDSASLEKDDNAAHANRRWRLVPVAPVRPLDPCHAFNEAHTHAHTQQQLQEEQDQQLAADMGDTRTTQGKNLSLISFSVYRTSTTDSWRGPRFKSYIGIALPVIHLN